MRQPPSWSAATPGAWTPSTVQRPGALPLKWVVSISRRSIVPAAASRMIAQSLPGPRRRRVSQPSAMVRDGPGLIRLLREPKNMSLAASA